MLMDLSDTYAFVRVVQCGSFSAAALATGVPKTRISRKVQELEARLGAPLLKRTTRRLGLTEAGVMYFARCAPLLSELTDAEHAVAMVGDTVRGRLTLTAPSWVAAGVLAPLLVGFGFAYPDVQLEIIASSEPLDLVTDTVDLAFRLWMGNLPTSQLTARRLGDLPMRIYASTTYFNNHAPPDRPEDLLDYPALAVTGHGRSDAARWRLSDGMTTADYPIRSVAITTDPEVLKQMMLAGGGLLLATELQMRATTSAGLANVVLPTWHSTGPSLYAVMPAGPSQRPKIRALLDYLIPRLGLVGPDDFSE